jgi:CheY-like chemotaxis protein
MEIINTSQIKPTIFLVDDDPEDRELLFGAFQQITDRYHIKMVNTGKDLVELLSGMNHGDLPCLIVLDYNMPEMNGKETLKFLNSGERFRHIPKVIYSTSNSFFEKAEFLSIGASDFMTKANSVSEILSAARKMLSYCEEEVSQSA